MLKIKHRFAVTIFFVLMLGQLLLVAVGSVSANHDTCPDTTPQAFLKCKDSRKQSANEQCFANNTGSNDAIAKCVSEVTAHFAYTGSGTPPPLPSGASASNSCTGSAKDTKSCIYQPTSSDPAYPYGKSCANIGRNACGIFDYINSAINLLSAVIGLVVTGLIIVGGIQYSKAGGDPGAVEKAKKLISKGIMTLVGYGLLFALAQWLLPGGIL